MLKKQRGGSQGDVMEWQQEGEMVDGQEYEKEEEGDR